MKICSADCTTTYEACIATITQLDWAKQIGPQPHC